MQVRGELGALLRADRARRARRPARARAASTTARGSASRATSTTTTAQQHVARGPQRVVEVEEEQRRADDERDAERRAPERAAARAPGARARAGAGSAALADWRQISAPPAAASTTGHTSASPIHRPHSRNSSSTASISSPMPVATLHESRPAGHAQRGGARLALRRQQRPREHVGDQAEAARRRGGDERRCAGRSGRSRAAARGRRRRRRASRRRGRGAAAAVRPVAPARSCPPCWQPRSAPFARSSPTASRIAPIVPSSAGHR